VADFSKPLTTSTYANFVSELDGRLDDLALMLNSSHTTPTNLPTNAVRFNGSSFKWEKYSGTAWADLAATYGISISGNAGTVTDGVVTTGSYANPAWITSLAGTKISGDITGNAGTATKLKTARNINGVAFDGSAAISVNTVQSVTFNNAGSGAASGTTFNGSAARTISYNTVGAPKTDGTGASGTWAISISGNAATASTASACSGNAATVTNGVYTTGNQSIAGIKTFSDQTIFSSGDTKGFVFSSNPGGGTGDTAFMRYYAETGEDTVLEIGVTADADDNIWLNASGGVLVQNNLTTTGTVTAQSDERLKTDWRSLPTGFVDALSQLKSGTYARISSGLREAGVSAQSLQTLLPEAVIEGRDGFLSVAYGNAALVAVVELAKDVVALRREIQLLKETK